MSSPKQASLIAVSIPLLIAVATPLALIGVPGGKSEPPVVSALANLADVASATYSGSLLILTLEPQRSEGADGVEAADRVARSLASLVRENASRRAIANGTVELRVPIKPLVDQTLSTIRLQFSGPGLLQTELPQEGIAIKHAQSIGWHGKDAEKVLAAYCEKRWTTGARMTCSRLGDYYFAHM